MDRVRVVFRLSYGVWVAGDIAAFDKARAEELFKMGVAERYIDPSEEIAEPEPEPEKRPIAKKKAVSRKRSAKKSLAKD
jgi:hypothetical protein